MGLKKKTWLSVVQTTHLSVNDWLDGTSVEAMIYHGVPGTGLVDMGRALPFTLSSPVVRSDASDTSP